MVCSLLINRAEELIGQQEASPPGLSTFWLKAVRRERERGPVDSPWTVVCGSVILMPSSNQPSNHRVRQRQGLEIPHGLCRRCVRALSRRLRDLPGMVSFQVDAADGHVWIHGEVDPAAAQDAVRGLSCS
jgi:hypothetical protein